MYINTFKYTPKDVSCQLCTEYVKKLGCTALRYPWLAERIEAGVVGYREAVLETFPHERRLFQRLNLLIKHYPGSLWSNEQHERRMQYQCAVQGYRRRRDTNAYYAAMYLLTSNDDIYRRTANCFCKDGIEFGYHALLQAVWNKAETVYAYRGFTMSVAFDSMWKTYTLTLKGQMTHRVELGSDARGNLVRIENALDKMPERLRSVQEQLENLYNQQAAAKAEVGKSFPQEQELAAKTARLIELDMELNLDGKGQPQPEQAIAKSTRPSVLDRLKAPPVHGAPEKPHKKEMEAR